MTISLPVCLSLILRGERCPVFHGARSAGNGNNSITGGKGADTLTGGSGVDTFKFVAGDAASYVFTASGADNSIGAGDTSTFAADGPDVITNFTQGEPTRYRSQV